MAFDKTLPADTEKLRDLGTVIRPNWDAIETADSSFRPEGINFAQLGADPTAIVNTLIAFSKNDASAVAQLYAINENSDVEQLTGNLSSGVSGAFTHYTYKLPGALGIIIKFGNCDSGNGAGSTLTFASAFPTACLGAIVIASNATATKSSVDTLTAASFKAYNDVGTLASYFIAWGN